MNCKEIVNNKKVQAGFAIGVAAIATTSLIVSAIGLAKINGMGTSEVDGATYMKASKGIYLNAMDAFYGENMKGLSFDVTRDYIEQTSQEPKTEDHTVATYTGFITDSVANVVISKTVATQVVEEGVVQTNEVKTNYEVTLLNDYTYEGEQCVMAVVKESNLTEETSNTTVYKLSENAFEYEIGEALNFYVASSNVFIGNIEEMAFFGSMCKFIDTATETKMTIDMSGFDVDGADVFETGNYWEVTSKKNVTLDSVAYLKRTDIEEVEEIKSVLATAEKVDTQSVITAATTAIQAAEANDSVYLNYQVGWIFYEVPVASMMG